MRVAVDVTPMVGGPNGVRTGIGQTVATLMAALPTRAASRGIEIVPYALSRRARQTPERLPAETRNVAIPARVLLTLWGRTSWPSIDRALDRPDVVHATNYLTPPTRRAVVWTHDVAFLRDPTLGGVHARAYGATMRRAARRGALFVTGASVIADDIRELLGNDFRNGADVAVVPLALPPLPARAPERVGPDRPYIVALGTSEPRKNLVRLVQAFGRIAATHPDVALVLAGPPGPDAVNVTAAIHALPEAVQTRVHELGIVSDAERVALLSDATVLAYPSLAEGFGIPMLEAMACEVPVVAGDAGSIPEVAGDAAILVHPTDVEAIADGLSTALSDNAQIAELIAHGKRNIDRFTVERMTDGIIATYERAGA
ncbi:MAG: glycosyltransferase family 4 protein [Acidimicrobiia bacterium]